MINIKPIDAAWTLLKMQVGDQPIEGLPHITWMSPEKRTGWIDGRLMMFGLPEWASNNEHTASVSPQ